MSADQAITKSWARLRRAVQHREHNEGADKWRKINDRNNFGPSIAAAMVWRPQ